MTLYPNKSGWISNLLDEAKQHLKVEGPLRLLELMSSKIFVIYRPDENIDHLTNTTQKVKYCPQDSELFHTFFF